MSEKSDKTMVKSDQEVLTISSSPERSKERFVIVYFLGALSVGDTFHKDIWPLHKTFTAPFYSYAETAKSDLDKAAAILRLCSITTGKQGDNIDYLSDVTDMYGDNQDTPVRLVNKSYSIGYISGVLIGTFLDRLDPGSLKYIGNHGDPHISIGKNPDPGPGKEMLIDKLYLVRYAGSELRVIDQVVDLRNNGNNE